MHDNGVADHLEGHGTLDWFFAQLAGFNKDKLDGLVLGDIAVAIS